MLKKLFIGIVIIVSVLGVAEAEDKGKKAAAEALMDAMNLEYSLQRSMSQMIELQVQQNPGLAPYREVMLAFFNKYMSYESLKGDMVKIYSDAFTEKELKEITAFYHTPTGQKTVQKLPELMNRGAQLGAMRVQQNIGELQAMIQAEAEKLEKQQSK